MMEHSLGVRKGAWSPEEDLLLRRCVEKYGEGKWRQVPLRAGLNRCRKSCRLRWLNYLHPNIKRGEFTSDEVDLIIRMHKLLGNRWSLIAGRLPGRTANDIKNYCNTHMKKMLLNRNKKDLIMKSNDNDINQINNVIKPKVIKVLKPLPRTFSSSTNNMSLMQHFKVGQTYKDDDQMPMMKSSSPSNIIIHPDHDDDDDDEKEEDTSNFSLSSFGEEFIKRICGTGGDDDQSMEHMSTTNGDMGIDEGIIMNNKEHWDDDDLHIDENLWSLLGLEQEIIM